MVVLRLRASWPQRQTSHPNAPDYQSASASSDPGWHLPGWRRSSCCAPPCCGTRCCGGGSFFFFRPRLYAHPCHVHSRCFHCCTAQDAVLRREGSLQAYAEVLISDFHRVGDSRCVWTLPHAKPIAGNLVNSQEHCACGRTGSFQRCQVGAYYTPVLAPNTSPSCRAPTSAPLPPGPPTRLPAAPPASFTSILGWWCSGS